MNQYCLAKVIQFESSAAGDQVVAELSSVSKSEHKNLLSVKKMHVGQMPGTTSSMLCIAFEQCSTSLYQAIVDGYRNGTEVSVRGLAKKLNPHNGTTTATAIQRITDIISGVQRLHFMNIPHLRLCPTNILIDNESTFKVSDFLGKYGLFHPSSNAVTDPQFAASVLAWQPPEIITEMRKNGYLSLPAQSLKKADIFSLGCCIFYAMTGQHPYGSFATGDRFAAGGATNANVASTIPPNQPLFLNGGTNEVIENMHADYISNQHLLYNCPLVLDLILRCLCQDPADRLDSGEMCRHPLFWDFDTIRTFILSLPMENEIFRKFCHYELNWKDIVASETLATSHSDIIPKFDPSILGILEFLIEAWNAAVSSNFRSDSIFPTSMPAAIMAPMCSVWLKILDRFPHVLIRAWDGVKIVNSKSSSSSSCVNFPNEAFKRNHLNWMMLRGSAITSISHSYVREYYAILNGYLRGVTETPNLTFPDESAGLTDACNAHCAGLVVSIKACAGPPVSRPPPCTLRRPAGLPRFSPVQQPAVPPLAPVVPVDVCGTPGMTFVDPLIVKQMAAASAALSAVYENPDLVRAIAKESDPSDAHSQLVAAVTIYASLLEQGSSNTQLAGARTSNIW